MGTPNVESIENEFLEGLEAESLPLENLLAGLRILLALGALDTARGCAELLQAELIRREAREGLLRLFRETADAFEPTDGAYAAEVLRALRRCFTERESVAFLEAAGVGKPPTAQALERFDWLRRCRPGAPCLEKHRGLGRVREIDSALGRLIVDFADQPGYVVPFAHAPDMLSWIEEDHLLVRQQSDPQAFVAWRRAHPGEMVRQALRDFGPLSVNRLETLLLRYKLLPETEWKAFWDQARKALKPDAAVSIPAKRTEPIRIQAEAQRYGDAWFAELAAERQIPEIVRWVTEWLDAGGTLDALNATARHVLHDRLAFAQKGIGHADELSAARLLLLAMRLDPTGGEAGDLLRDFSDPQRLGAVGVRLNVREAETLVGHLLAVDDANAQALVEAIDRLPFALIGPIIAWSADNPQPQAQTDAVLRARLNARDPATTLLAWCLRNRQIAAKRDWIDTAGLLTHALAALEQPLMGEGLRMQHQIRRYFESGADLKRALAEMTNLQREALFNRLRNSPGWDSTAQRTVLGRMIKFHPELGELAARAAEAEAEPPTAARLTSWRSYHARRAQLKRLVEVDIPANSREIGQARSYGDLRENFEYHAARHQQGLLMQRRADLERDLEQVRGSDFADADPSRVGPGLTVTTVDAAGVETRYTILGEWDRDAKLNIISSESRTAKQLQGRRVGDTVELTDAQGEPLPVTLRAIEPLDASRREWIAATV